MHIQTVTLEVENLVVVAELGVITYLLESCESRDEIESHVILLLLIFAQ